MKLAGACILSCVFACLTTLPAAFLALAIGFCLLCLSRASWRSVWPRLAAANLFVLFMWLVVPLTSPGPPIWQWGFFAISATGLWLCLLLTLKANAILAVFLALVAPMSLTVLARALCGLRCPERLAWLLLLLERNVHILGREWRTLRAAASLRAFEPASGMRAYRTYGAMLAQLLLRAHDRGQRLHEAMLLAGFNGRLPWSAPLRRIGADIIFGLLVIACCLLLFYV